MRREQDRRRASALWKIVPAAAMMFLAWACASGGNASDAPADPTAAGGSDAGGAGGAGGDPTAAGGDALGPVGTGGNNTAGFPSMGGTSSAGKGGTSGGTAGAGAGGKGGAAGGGAGGAPAMGATGSPCTMNSQCISMKCVDTGHPGNANMICVDPCKTGAKCAMGTHCTTVAGASVCIPDRDSECATCTKDTDCKNQGDRCLAGAGGEKLCAQDCGYDGNCGAGFECKSVPMANPGDKACFPAAGAACACGPNRDGATRACTNMNASVTCTGSEKCDGKMAKYLGCTAAMPPPAGMCAALPTGCTGTSGGFPHATCNCAAGSCALLCDTGFAHYPTTLPDAAGCPCAVDPGQPGKNQCTTAMAIAAITDTGTSSVKLTGTLSGDDEVDWYDIAIDNKPAGGTNGYHVRVTLDANPGSEFAFVVLRGGDCTKAAAAPTLTSYDWCVNYTAAGQGEAPCGTGMAGINQCGDHSSPYKIGVKRSATAATKTCAPYSVSVQAAAGPCDLASIDACGMTM